MGNAMAERSGGEKSLDPRGQIVPYHAAITNNLATIRGRYVPVWSMAGTGTPANLNTLHGHPSPGHCCPAVKGQVSQ